MYTSNDIKNLIKEIRQHYESNLSNKYVKHIIMKLDLPHMVLQDMKRILESEMVYVDTRGAVEDLYNGIKAIGYLIKELQSEVIPNIKAYADANVGGLNQNEKILYQMAVRNFPQNINIFAEKVYHLFEMVFYFDKEKFADNPAYAAMNSFNEITQYFSEIIEKYKKKNGSQ